MKTIIEKIKNLQLGPLALAFLVTFTLFLFIGVMGYVAFVSLISAILSPIVEILGIFSKNLRSWMNSLITCIASWLWIYLFYLALKTLYRKFRK